MDSHYRLIAERQGFIPTRWRDDRRLSASATSLGVGACSNSDALCDSRGRSCYWPVFLPPAPPAAAAGTQATAPTAPLRGANGTPSISGGGGVQLPLATMGKVRQLADRARVMDSHSTGPGPAFVVETQEPAGARADEPRSCSAAAVATSRFRQNSRLMGVLLSERVVESNWNQDWPKVYSKRRTQRLLLEKKLCAMRRETRDLEVLQKEQRRRWLREADAFRENLRKCGQKEHLLEVARTWKVQGSASGQPTMPSNCKTAFRLKCVP
ncbi:uncharacterized protein [Dermacentor andersoni]|uniref:uncharacterized protein n=1 Tax=Dermacentor andersoni TaxID=34620 RepID=UPI003B3A53BF